MIKESKLKAQSSIMENKVRVTAKKIDDLRTIMAMLKEEKFDIADEINQIENLENLIIENIKKIKKHKI